MVTKTQTISKASTVLTEWIMANLKQKTVSILEAVCLKIYFSSMTKLWNKVITFQKRKRANKASV